MLSVDEARALLNTIDTSSPVGLRDRALIGLMVYTFAHVGAAIKMRLKDVYLQGRRTWVRLHEKRASAMRCLVTTILKNTCKPTSRGADRRGREGFLFRTAVTAQTAFERPI